MTAGMHEGWGPILLVAVACTTAKNDCETAAEQIVARLVECGVPVEGPSNEDDPECECSASEAAAAQCIANCVSAAECSAFDGTDIDASVAYTECLADCPSPTCAPDPGGTGNDPTAGTSTTMTPMSSTDMNPASSTGTDPTADDTGTTTDDDSGTTGGGPAVELEPGTYMGTTSAEQMQVFTPSGTRWFGFVAASAFGMVVDLTSDTVVEEVGSSDSVAMGDAAGMAMAPPSTKLFEAQISTVFFGFPGLRYAMYDGNAFGPLAPIDGFLPAARLAMAPSSTGAATQVCGASDQGLISCVNATGSDWAEDPATTTDMAWRADCVGFSAEGLAVDEGWAMLLFGTGTICHGQLGPGNVATALPLFPNDVEDLECPSDSVGTSPICAVLERAGTVSIVGWQMPSATPVVIDTIATCDDSTELAGLVSADDATVSFATACAGSDESHLITVDAGTGALVSHMVHGLPGCSGRVAALPTEDRVAVACSGTIEILDVADFTPM